MYVTCRHMHMQSQRKGREGMGWIGLDRWGIKSVCLLTLVDVVLLGRGTRVGGVGAAGADGLVVGDSGHCECGV